MLLISSFAWAGGPIQCAKVAIVIGQATNEKGDPIDSGQSLGQGAKIKTGPGSFMKIILRDDSVLDIGSLSHFIISACEGKDWVTKINLELINGKIRANVNKIPKISREEFKLKTPTSIVAVRGTEFFVSWEKTTTGNIFENVAVKEGQVEISSLFDLIGAGTVLSTGTEFKATGRVSEIAGQIKVEASAPPKVDQFSAEEQRQFEQNSKADQKAFEKSVEIPSGIKGDSEAKNKKTDAFLATATQELSKSGREPAQTLDATTTVPKLPGFERRHGPGSTGVFPGTQTLGDGQINQPGFPNLVPMTFVWGVKK
jgi:hypothetical protein